MGRIRTIKPEFWIHEELSSLSAETHMLAAGLLNYADDYGFFNPHPALIKAAVFPLRETCVAVAVMVDQLVKIGYIRIGASPDGKKIGEVCNFLNHQRVSHPTESRYRNIEIAWEPSGNIREDSRKAPELLRPEGKGKEVGKEGNGASPISPEMITRSVLTELGLSGRDLAVVLDEVCRSQMKLYETPGALRDAMVTAWREYDLSKPKLGYTKGAAKFFGDGDWRNKAGWPWKPGESPPTRKAQQGEDPALRAIREREDAVRRERAS